MTTALEPIGAGLATRRLAQWGPFNWSALGVRRAARGALGVTLPLVVGALTGHLDYGAYAALGALPAGFASFEGQTRSRVAGVALASIGMAVSTFVGATTAAAAPWLLPGVVAIWAYATGLSICLGPVASVAVLQWAVALLIAIGLPFGVADAALRSGFVLAGGLLQAALVAASWSLRPGAREQASLAASYAALAADASRLASSSAAALPAAAFTAGPALADANPLLPDARRLLLLDLLEEAERVRAALAALAAGATGAREGCARTLLHDAAGALELVSWALAASPRNRGVYIDALNARIARWGIAPDAAWRWSGEALAARLRSVAGLLQTLGAPAPRAHPGPEAASPARAHGFAVLATVAAQLRTHMVPTTEAGRHALRLAIVAGLAEAMVQALGLTQGRWVTLTVLIVLKPDYASTFVRGLHRALGTALGACIAAAIAQLGHSAPDPLILACAAAIALAYALFRVNYLLYSVPLTVFILVLQALLGLPAVISAEARVVDTALGAALGLLAYLAWPTWKGASARQDFATLFQAHADYATQLLREFAHPGSVGAARLRLAQGAARRARSDAEAATARLADEPSRPQFSLELARLLIGTVARLASAELALHALVDSASGEAGAIPAAPVDRLGAALGTALTGMATALRSSEAPSTPMALRPLHVDLVPAPGSGDDAFVTLADRLVDATNAADELLRGRFAPQRASTGAANK